jgi:hypothetical protein
MPSLLSAVSGQLTKYLVLGTLLPVAIFMALGLVFGQPITPTSVPLVHALETLDKQWFAIAVTAGAVVVSGLLYNLNTPIIRLYEGYPWRASKIGQWRIRRIQERLDRATQLRERMKITRKILEENNADKNLLAELQSQRTRVSVLTHSGFPSRSLILPTRLGNAIKSFEEYPYRQYGMDAVTLWPRIIAVASKDYLTGIDDAKTSLDFFLNASFLSAITSAALLLIGLAFKRPFANDLTFALWALEVCGLAGASWLFYRSSIGRAAAWGDLVKGTFDLYRWDLLKRFGYSQTPDTRQHEHATWTEISQQVIYGDPEARPPMAYVESVIDDTVLVETTPPGVQLRTVYGMKKNILCGNLSLICQITNLDSKRSDGMELRVKPRKGWELVWGSALVRRNRVTASATISGNRQFNLGSLESLQEAVFTCNLMRVPVSEEASHDTK